MDSLYLKLLRGKAQDKKKIVDQTENFYSAVFGTLFILFFLKKSNNNNNNNIKNAAQRSVEVATES